MRCNDGMNKRNSMLRILKIILVIFLLCSLSGCFVFESEMKSFLRQKAGKPNWGKLTEEDCAGITKFNAIDYDVVISDLDGIQLCKNLRVLNLGMCNITDLSPLSELENLQILNLTWNDATFDISPLRNLKNLEEAYLCDNYIVDLSPLCNLPKLAVLDISIDENTDLQPIMKMKNLQTVFLRNVNLDGENVSIDLNILANHTDLKKLILFDVNVQDNSPLANLDALNLLSIVNCTLDGISSIKYLKNLEYFTLMGTNVRDISAISNLTKLRQLTIKKNPVRDISSIKNLKNLTSLDLTETQIKDISALSNLQNLDQLSLKKNSIEDIGPIRSLVNLRSLNLSNNNINDISALEDLVNLGYLVLENNDISDITPLVNNEGLGEDTEIYLMPNPLSEKALNEDVPALEARGVNFWYLSRKGKPTN